ncbi:ClbS/DfsB family four-helix bundle protein [Dietzia cercidiphylli]|uniref:ClbS/DfsB family four-helix bundle protein n=1 Tax=Dietzia TaxID=37914 RepID=UPI00394F95A3
MPRPTTRSALLEAAAREYERLRLALGRFDPAVVADLTWEADIEDTSRHPRDVLTHIHAWQLLALGWAEAGEAGGRPQIPGEGRTWRETPAINAEIRERYLGTSYADAVDLLAGSHARCLGVIASHSDDELFTRGRYAWTGSTTLGAYFVSATSSHYVWGQKTLRRIQRALPTP